MERSCLWERAWRVGVGLTLEVGTRCSVLIAPARRAFRRFLQRRLVSTCLPPDFWMWLGPAPSAATGCVWAPMQSYRALVDIIQIPGRQRGEGSGGRSWNRHEDVL